MIIRRAKADDAAALTDCIAAAYAPYQHLGLPPVAEGVGDDIARHTVWVAEDDAILGGLVAVIDDRFYLANLAVHPDAGGRGVGRALITHAEGVAQRLGYTEIALATHTGMTGTQAFYHRIGWVEVGREGNKVHFSKQLD